MGAHLQVANRRIFGIGRTVARDESGGAIGSVTDDDILDAYKSLAALEGVFVEPASAASIAGLRAAARDGDAHDRRQGATR